MASVWSLPDANTIRQFEMADGVGSTITDSSAAGVNATINWGTGGAPRWYVSTDKENVAPGERAYPWGYVVGSDGANDGLTIIEDAEVTAGTSYVVRAALSIGMSGRAYPFIRIYDNTGAANIVDFYYPRMTGQHTGANNAAALTDAGSRWVQSLVGWTIYNITDGSSATITAQTETTITATLAGGTDNDWDTNDVYLIRPPSYRTYSQHPWSETFVVTAPAGCTSIDVKVLNAAGEGVMHVHQVEVLESLIPNGDHESLNGGFPGAAELITGFTNLNLDAGDTEPEAVVVHAGVQSLEWNTVAAEEGMYRAITVAASKFFSIGWWVYGTGTKTSDVQTGAASQGAFHNDASSFRADGHLSTNWGETARVWRAAGANPTLYFIGEAGAGTDRWTDDLYAIVLNDVSLTVTPASEANSLENGGIRVDGYDKLTTSVESALEYRGAVSWRIVPRRAVAIDQSFAAATHHFALFGWFDGNNYITVRSRSDVGADRIELQANTQGVLVSDTFQLPASVVWAAGDDVLLTVQYDYPRMSLFVSGRYAGDLEMANTFASPLTTLYYGSGTLAYQFDAVVKEP